MRGSVRWSSSSTPSTRQYCNDTMYVCLKIGSFHMAHRGLVFISKI